MLMTKMVKAYHISLVDVITRSLGRETSDERTSSQKAENESLLKREWMHGRSTIKSFLLGKGKSN